jgi:Glycosyl hydrolase catalytic core/F5/8 type C domain
MIKFRTLALMTGVALVLAGCGSQAPSHDLSPAELPAPAASLLQAAATATKSAKRGVAYDLASPVDLAALAPGVSWWYNWASSPNPAVPADHKARYGMDYLPMLWNGNFNTADIEGKLRANPSIRYLLLLNEPNLSGQATLTPTQAANLWPRYEQVAADTGVQLVGPAITWGNLAGFQDPVVWMDAFYAAYRSQQAGRDPRIDYLAFHWYDYGLGAQLDRLKKYGKPFWVTEFANWHSGDGSAQIDSVAKQKTQMAEMVALLEARSDVFRYAWFTGRWANDAHFTGLLGASGQLTELGQYYLSLPFAGSSTPSSCGTTNLALKRPAGASSSENAGTPVSAALDGDPATRWSSAFADPQTLQVDLGSVQQLCAVTLQWEAAFGRAFSLEVSSDNRTWTPLYSTMTGTGGTQKLTVSGSGQHLRLTGTARATPYGYSLYELQAFGPGR